MRQLNVWAMLGIWAGLSLGAAFYAAWEGYEGRAFAVTVATFSILLLVMVAFVIYLAGTGSFAVARAGAMAAFVFLPLGLAVSSRGAAAGSWQDFLTVAIVWVFVKFGPTHWMWPYPGGRLAYVFTVLMAVSVALACFLLVRRAEGAGYSIGWGRRWELYVLGSFVLFGCVAIPLGIKMRFIAFDPHWGNWRGLLVGSLGILFLTAWPAEFLFRTM